MKKFILILKLFIDYYYGCSGYNKKDKGLDDNEITKLWAL